MAETRKFLLAPWTAQFALPARYKSAYGGRGSGKTWSFAHLLIWRIDQRPTRVACGREFQSSITVSAKPALERAIYNLGLSKDFTIYDHTIRHRNGSLIFFKGMERNREEIRGWEGVDIVWIEEAQRLSDATARVLIPTIRKPGSELWFSWNPANRSDWVWRRFIVSPDEKDVVQKVNYDLNPAFPDEAEEERQRDLRDDPELYRHIWLGEPNDDGAERQILPYSTILSCVEAFEKGLHLQDGGSFAGQEYREAGLDIADRGVDYNALTIRN